MKDSGNVAVEVTKNAVADVLDVGAVETLVTGAVKSSENGAGGPSGI